MAVRRFLALLVLLAAALVSSLLLSDRLLIAALKAAVFAGSDYRLQVDNPSIQWLPLRFSSSLLLLKPDAASAPPLFALQQVSLEGSPWALARGETTGSLRISNLSLYIDETAPGGRPEATTLLRPLSLFPDAVAIDTLHLIDRREDVWIFPLVNLASERRADGSMALSATTGSTEAPLRLDAVITPHLGSGGVDALDISAAALGQGYSSALTLQGRVEAAADNLLYDLAIKGAYAQVSDFLRAFDPEAVTLAGRLEVAGTLRGDLDQLQLDIDQLLVDNAPDYRFGAAGAITQSGQESPALDLRLDGKLTTLNWVPALPERYRNLLSTGKASVGVSGTLEVPQIDQVSLSAEGESGLRITASAENLRATRENLAALLENAPLIVRISGAGAASLAPFVDEILPAVGQWSASATFIQHAQRYRVDDLELVLNIDDTSTVSFRGAIESLIPNNEGSEASATGLNGELILSGDGPHHNLAQWLGLNELGLLLDQASLRIDGSIAELSVLRGVALTADVAQLRFSDADGSSRSWPALPLTVGGRVDIRRAAQPWQLVDIAATGELADGTGISLTGDSGFDQRLADTDFRIQLSAAPGTTLQWPGPLQIASPAATAQIRIRDSYATMLGALETPHAPLQVVVSADLEDAAPTHLAIDVYARSFDLGDLRYQPPDRSGERASETTSSPPNEEASVPPLHATLRFDDLHGTRTAFSSLLVDVEGENNRYLLRQLDADYDSGLLRLRGLLDLGGAQPLVSLAGEGTRVPLAALAADLGLQESVTGELSMRGGVTGSGSNLHNLLGTLNGRVSLAISDATVSGPAYDLLMSNLLAWLATGASEKVTTFDCSMAQFDISDGVARSDSLYIQTPRMLATGKARIDLNEDFVDARIDPRSRSRTLQFPSAVKIKGPLSGPEVSVSPLQATGDAAAQALLLIPSLTLKLFGISSKDNDRDPPCRADLS